MSKAAVPKLQPKAKVSCPPKPITFLVFSAENCLSGYVVVHLNVNVIHSPKNLRTSGLMLASVSHKMGSAVGVSLVPLPIPTTQLPITSLFAALPGACEVLSCWNPGMLRDLASCVFKSCLSLWSTDIHHIKEWEQNGHGTISAPCCGSLLCSKPLQGLRRYGEVSFKYYNVGRTSCILTWTRCSRWAVNPASPECYIF